MSKLIYYPNEAGGWKTDGELPSGTKWVTIEIAGRSPLNVVRKTTEAQIIVEDAIRGGHAPAEWYALVPAAASNAMSEEAKEKLRELGEKKKQDREIERERLARENAEDREAEEARNGR